MDSTYGIAHFICISTTLGKAYGWNGTDMTVLTINAVATFLGVITGMSAYNLKK